jgi:hypothetical protein
VILLEHGLTRNGIGIRHGFYKFINQIKIHKIRVQSDKSVFYNYSRLLRFLKLYVRFESKKLITKFDDELDIITNRSNTMGLKEFVLDRERRMARKEEKEEFTQNLLTQTDFSDDKIATLANVTVDYVKKIRVSLN